MAAASPQRAETAAGSSQQGILDPGSLDTNSPAEVAGEPAIEAREQRPGGADPSLQQLAERMDSMRTWAAETQSQIKGLVAANQVINARTEQINALQDQVDLIAGHVAAFNVTPSQIESFPLDGAIGYKPSPEQQSQLFLALADWQAAAKPLEKGQTANIQTRQGGSVQYKYADIASVSEIARSAGSFGLAHFHREISIQGATFIRTYLLHKAGGWVSCDVPLLLRENTLISSLQQWASACTMARRYGLFMILGIAAGEEDDDGAASDGPRRGQAPTTSPAPAARTAPTTRTATR
jgi:hypothetical protein